jgi:UDP-GlcNAc3NAcA epimerase
MKLLTIVGARPQFIKAAAVSRQIITHPEITEVVLHTGQHYDHNMSEVFFREMNIPHPQFNLNIQSGLQGEMTGRMTEGIEKVILSEKPDAVLLYGDTNSTLAGAIASSKLLVKIIHVEAGLRSFDMNMPEEINRILTDRVSDLLCCPTDTAMNNLSAEGFDKLNVTKVKTGDVMNDMAIYYSRISRERSSIMKKIKEKEFVLCTFHRAENTNDPQRLSSIISAINLIHKKTPVYLPLHPRTKKTVEALNLSLGVNAIEPQGYFDMLELIKNCSLVITDSGGLQKEAYFFKKPCICMRDETEWTELSSAGYVKLTGSDSEKIIDAFENYKNMPSGFSENFYGDGNAAAKITEEISRL